MRIFGEEGTTTDRDKTKAAQQERSKRYHIAVKDGGSVTKPGEWSSVPDDAFGDPVNYSYPMPDKSHADNAASRWGDTSNRSQYNSDEQKIIGNRIAARQRHFGEKPSEKQESTATVTTSTFRPQKKIATLKVCFLEDNARSLNGRIYPTATVNRIVASAIAKLANPEALPVTCFISHETANSNTNTDLVGRVTKIWREGTKIYALIDLADTRVSRDMLALAEGGYMRSESMRVLGVELRHDNNYDLPLVVPQEGVEPELLGIDLTTRPGLMDTARIQQVLYESITQANQPYTEAFQLDHISIEQKEMPMSIPIYLQIIAGMMQEATTPDRAAHQRVHDHLAGVLDEAIKPVHGSESATPAGLSEEGKAIAQKHAVKLAKAHDESARQCGLTCECGYHEALGFDPADKDMDGDHPSKGDDPDNDGESARGAENTMTEQEALALLKAKGYNVAPPKTADEQIAELRTLLESQQQEIATLKAVPPPQRQTQVESAFSETGGYQPEPLYEDGSYLEGPMNPKHWKAMSNRRVPWPKDVDPKAALHEMAPFLAYRLVSQEAAALGRDITSLVKPNERM